MVERAVRDVAEARPEVTTAAPPKVGRGAERRPPAPRARRGSRTILTALKRVWIPLVLLVVICAGGFTVARLHGAFGSEKHVSYADTGKDDAKPFNPKHLTYEVFGPPGTVADISYFDDNGDPQFLRGVPCRGRWNSRSPGQPAPEMLRRKGIPTVSAAAFLSTVW